MSMMMLPEEDAATIQPEDVPGLIESGAISVNQPGLRFPPGYTPPRPETDGKGNGDDGRNKPIRTKQGSRYEGTGPNRVRYDIFNLAPLEEGPFADPETKAETPEDTGTNNLRWYRTNPELLSQLQAQLAILQAFTDRRAANLVGYGEAAVQGFLEGTYSFEGVFGSLTDLLGKARAAVAQTDGTGTGTGGNDPTKINQNALAKLKGYLAEYGLSSLDEMLQEIMARGIEDETSVLFELRNTDAFKTRFKANEARKRAGLPALTPRAYVDMENTYREVLRRGGMLEYFNQQDIFESLIAGDVSAAELYDRMTNAYQVVRDADAGTKAQMRELYNVEDKDLAAYFLNPGTSVSMLKRRAEAAKIASIGKEQGGMQLTPETAEDIAARGYTTAQAGTAFTTLTQQAGLYEALPGEEGLTEQERLGAAFGYDPMAALRLEKRKAGRKAVFEGGGQFASTRGATSGVTETGLGGPQ